MFTLIVIAALSALWWQRWKRYQREPTWPNRRRSVASLYAVIGAIIGSYFGVAGFGSAIAGTIPGALVAYLAIGYYYKVDRSGHESPSGPGPTAGPEPTTAPQPTAWKPANDATGRYHVDHQPDAAAAKAPQSDTTLITCFHCGAKLAAPVNQRLKIKCGGCKTEFEIST